ncbi:MAG: hypothetical protein K1V97_07165 [Lachnospiraceae bacterium]
MIQNEKINLSDKNKIICNIGVIIGIQICLSLFALALEVTVWSAVNSCYAGLFAPIGIFLSVIIVPILLYLTARKCLVCPDSPLNVLLCTFSVPIFVLFLGFCFAFSKNWDVQAIYYLCNPMAHGFEYYFMEYGDGSITGTLPNSSAVALCLAQVAEAGILTLGILKQNRQETEDEQ